METKPSKNSPFVSVKSGLVSTLVSVIFPLRFRFVSKLISVRFSFPALWRETGSESESRPFHAAEHANLPP